MKYREICEEYMNKHWDGIFFAFNEDQFKEGLKELGLENEKELKGKLFKGPYGEYGTKEGFVNREKGFEQMSERIKTECSPEEIFEYEYYNHECGYTGDWTEAINITNCYFPDWKPSTELLNKLWNNSNL